MGDRMEVDDEEDHQQQQQGIVDQSQGKLKPSIRDYVEGSIVRVKLVNFVTYSEIEFTPGPRLNVIIGPNGSGKSSIVCALALGLGGGTNLLGRAKQISDFIKHGQEHAVIEIELYHNGGRNNMIVRRDIYNDNSSSFRLNGKKMSTHELVENVRKLNIQIDNLCQFLPQDKVVSFAAMSKTELLVETEKAIGLHNMYENHQKLINIKKEIETLQNSFSGQANILEDLIKQNQSIEREVARFQERERINKTIADYEKKRAWLLFEQSRTKVEELKNSKIEWEKKMAGFEKEKAPLEAMSANLKKSVDQLTARVEDTTKKARAIDTTLSRSTPVLDKIAQEIDAVHDNMTNFRRRADDRKVEVNKLTAEVQRIQQQIQDLPTEKDVQIQIDSKNKEIKELNVKTGQVQYEMNTLKQSRDGFDRAMQDVRKQLDQLSNEKQRKLDQVRRAAPDTYRAYEMISKFNFSQKIFGPVCIEITPKNDLYASFLETTLPNWILTAFVCQNEQDRDIFQREIISKNNLQQVSTVYVPSPPRVQRECDIEQLRKYGIECFLDQTFDCPQQVRDAILDNSYISNFGVGSKKTVGLEKKIFDETSINLFFTPENSYSRTRSRYDNSAQSVKVSNIKPSKVLSAGGGEANEARQRELEKKHDDIQKDQQELLNQIKKMEIQVKTIDGDIKKLLAERGDSSKVNEERKKLHSKITSSVRKIEEYSREENVEEAEENFKEQINKLQTKRVAIIKENVKALIEQAKITVEAEAYTLQKAKEESRFHSEFKKLDELEAQIKICKSEVDIRIRQHADATREARHRREEAEKLASVKDDNVRAMLESLSDDLDEIEAGITAFKSKAELITHTNPGIMREYENREKEIAQLRARIEGHKGGLASILEKKEKLKEEWLLPVNEFIEQINKRFTRYFANIGCSGEILLGFDEKSPDDFEKYAIEIKVRFREEETLKTLNAHQQSGGERSVSTMLFLISLQDLTNCPFRVVDEINQGMDPKNERMIFDQIVKTANRPGLPQYFLITPKLLHDLEYSTHTTVLCVFTGPWHITQKEWEGAFNQSVNRHQQQHQQQNHHHQNVNQIKNH